MLGKLIDYFFSIFTEETKNRLRYSKLNFVWNIYLNFRLAHSNALYFGQNEEDRLLLNYLDESKGRFVDIRAGWPVRGSNSYYFYKLGWDGLTVDPIRANTLLHKFFGAEILRLGH